MRTKRGVFARFRELHRTRPEVPHWAWLGGCGEFGKASFNVIGRLKN